MHEAEFPRVVARQIVDQLRRTLASKPTAVICPSAGRTVDGIYQTLCEEFSMAVDWGRVTCIQMDEYAGIEPDHPQSLCSQLKRQLIRPLGIGHLHCFNDADGSLRIPLADYERRLLALGGIDVAIHGVGVNGHIGFNEPNSVDMARTRQAVLHPSTKAANKVSFNHAFTLGMDALLTARVSIVAARGRHKRPAIERFLYDPAGPDLPVSYLRTGGSVAVVLEDSVGVLPVWNTVVPSSRD